jgi:hypothetical protein|tara:strand:- start:615 stop:827 length:213 start_codon:yes stop_codon:yes gene_type:complete
MFHNLTELIIDIPSPARIRGIALFKDALRLLMLPTDKRSINENVSIGLLSCRSNIIEPIKIAIKNPIRKE